MSLIEQLKLRESDGKPIRVGLIGAGKFGSMFLSQIRRTPGMHLLGVADLSPDRARASLSRVGWPEEQYAATSFSDASKNGTTYIVDNADDLIAADGLDVVVDATGHPAAGISHAQAAVKHGRHIVMVNVEADVLAGPLLAKQARDAGLHYSMAYGDQPALIAEMVDWAEAAGFEVVCAGKGTKYLPQYHTSTPDTVWSYYGFSEEQIASGDFNAQMFNSFLDGTKSAIEMAAVANATGLGVPSDGLKFPPCGVDDIPSLLRPASDGGMLERKGMVEVISSLERDGRPVFKDLRWGVYCVFEAPSDYVQQCFAQYGMQTDSTGRYGAMFKPYHLIGLELGISVANIMLRGEATGSIRGFSGDAVSTSKRDLKAGEVLDGEGGFMVYGKLMPAADSLARGGLPIGLAHGAKLKRDVEKGETVCWSDIEFDPNQNAVRVRREMEAMFAGQK